MTGRRFARFTAVLMVFSVALIGCDRRIGLDDPVQVRVADGELQFRVCTAVVATSILVQARGDGDWEDVWWARGSVDLQRGDVIATSTLDDLFASATTAVNPELVSGDEVAVILYKESGNIAGAFDVNDTAISGEWIGTVNEPDSSC